MSSVSLKENMDRQEEEHQGQGHAGPTSTKNKIDGRDGLVD